MDDVRIFYNPSCSKCRASMDMLRERDIDPDVVEYLKNPPTAEEIRDVIGLLGVGARGILRTTEPLYKELGLDDLSLDDDALIAALAEHPILIQRPIVIANGKAVIGRPPEKISSIL
jgi:arsenate reductase